MMGFPPYRRIHHPSPVATPLDKHAQGAMAQQLPHDLFDGTAGRPSLFSNDAPVSAVHEELEEAKKRGTPCGMRARLGAAGGDLLEYVGT